MARLPSVDPDQASGKAKQLLDTVQAQLGATPNMTKTMATAPAVLEGWLALNGALGRGHLPAGLREQLALAIAEANRCSYCLSIHTHLASQLAKLPEAEIQQNRQAASADPKIAAALQFARLVNQRRGEITDADLQRVRAAGYSDAEIAEIVAHVALNVLTNYFNKTAGTDIDFPPVHPLARPAA